jgi:hypothetical protein
MPGWSTRWLAALAAVALAGCADSTTSSSSKTPALPKVPSPLPSAAAPSVTTPDEVSVLPVGEDPELRKCMLRRGFKPVKPAGATHAFYQSDLPEVRSALRACGATPATADEES